ncbi:porin [Cupriavidus consociatus]|uniref:porin n=1 Tax=Cupriavidus consociatus TaxID=2821357 RepID=UPI001AE24366|nr:MULTISPECIES: porin [unclassified Cupriavidus]MBP0625272.1 porin [Cupriavidus sp. LEh25]MDK2662009.1 porin [Cupriavidus sp. LEh21]
MKRTIFFLTVVCACSAADAQSSVTLYGVMDLNMEYVNHVGVVPQASNGFNPGQGNKVVRMDAGGYSGSRWGLRGLEDLGGGLKSIFVLENGFNSDTGTLQQGGRLFGRQAYVGLNSEYGQITFGRQSNSMFATLANFVPLRFATQYEPVGVIAGANFREDNMAQYTGVFGGLTARAHWSFGVGTVLPQVAPNFPAAGGNGEVPGQFRRDSGYGAGLSYLAGPFGVGIGYDQWNPTIGTGNGSFKKAVVMASYALNGTAKVMGGYRWGQSKDQNSALILRDDFYWVGGQYRFSPALDFTLEYDYQNVKNLGRNTHIANPWQIALIADYALSKRTDVYLTTAYSKNAGLAMESAAGNFATSLALNSYTLPNGQTSMIGVAVGIRHIF